MTEAQRSRLGGLWCAVLAGLAVLLCVPFAEMGFIDDWSYIRTAYEFARTGHFVFNGWATAMLGWQILWSAPFLKLFGYSFTVARLSMLPFACGCGWLLHTILRHGNVTNRNAIFGSLTLCLSPLFIPLAASYMSDAGAIFVVLLCMYLCQRAVETNSGSAAILWLCAATLTSVIGGTERQIMWLGALVMVPSAAWLLRKRRGMIPAAGVLWMVSVVLIQTSIHWFYRQPYSVPERLFTFSPQGSESIAELLLQRMALNYVLFRAAPFPIVFLKTFLCLLLIILPILIAWLIAARNFGRPARISLGVLACGLSVGYWILGLRGQAEDWLMPWLYHELCSEAISPQSWDMLGHRPVTLAVPVRAVVSIIVVLSGVAFAQWLFAARRKRIPQPSVGSWTSSWKTLLCLFLPYFITYLLCLVPRGLHAYVFDRYLLGIMPVVILYLLKLYEEKVGRSLPLVCYLTLSFFAIYGICATHDLFALNRARVAAVNEVRSQGVGENAVQAGFEYDGWTQIDQAGYVNESKIEYPANAFHVNLQDRRRPADCRLGFDPYTPALHPKFIVVLTPMWCLERSNFSSVSYHAWLPPFSRRVYIQKVPEQMQDQ